MKQFLETGKITGTHGLKGEVRVQPWADSPEFLTEFDELYLDNGARKIVITSSRVHKGMLIMKIKGVDSIEDADRLRDELALMVNGEWKHGSLPDRWDGRTADRIVQTLLA